MANLAASLSKEPLEHVAPIINNSIGALFEGDVFSVLRHSPYTIRSFEFALTDGAIDCSYEYHPSTSFADRLLDVDDRSFNPTLASVLATFDVKATGADSAVLTSGAQQRSVAAYVCIEAGNPAFVTLVPNVLQRPDSPTPDDEHADSSESESEDDESDEAVNLAESKKKGSARKEVTPLRSSRLPRSAHDLLDPKRAPHRMPLAMLGDAISSIYTNPWTGVPYPWWNPSTITETSALKPSEKSHQSACRAALDIAKAMRRRKDSSMTTDLVGLQPRLADFKIVCDSRQYFVQHKLSGRTWGKETKLDCVLIGRSGEGKGWFFSPQDRFDFFWYEFEFSQTPNPQRRTEFYFLPERVIPDTFYTTLEKHVDFETNAFVGEGTQQWKPGRRGYRIIKDEDDRWVDHVRDIILANPQPRRPGPRPQRPAATSDDEVVDKKTNASSLAPAKKGKSEKSTGNAQTDPSLKVAGLTEWAAMMKKRHREFFYRLMHRCAAKRSGLIVAFAKDESIMDFGICRYTWTTEEQRIFQQYQRPPKFLHDLPSSVELVPIVYYTRYVESSYFGPNVTPFEFQRLDSATANRLVIWDLGGPDTADPILAIIPSLDIQPTAAQRKVFEENRAERGVWTAKTPTLSSLLDTGLHVGEYVVGSYTPPMNSVDWDDVWTFLFRFTGSAAGVEQFEHPVKHRRAASHYRITICEALTHAAWEFAYHAAMDDGAESEGEEEHAMSER